MLSMNQIQLIFRFFKITLTASSVLIVYGCTTLLSHPTEQLTPEDHKIQASRYVALAESAPEPVAYEYRLRAADQYLKAAKLQEAREMIRSIQNTGTHLDAQSQTNLLEARLALLQNDSRRAQVMLNSLLAPYAQNPHLLTMGVGAKPGQKIALLLPTQGPHAAAAKTIRDGFLAAYYKTLQHSPSDPKVQVYDTGQGDNVENAYQQAIAEKADFIVGPLTKAEVQAIAGIKLDIPVLALNSIQDASHHKKTAPKKSDKLFQFGLMPEDEIASTVANASKRGHKKVIVVAPNNEWGQRISTTFQKLWAHKGGETIQILNINPKEDLDTLIQTALQKSNKSPKKADMIFLVASPELARQLTPLINHYQKNALPVYATSSVYSGKPSPKQDQDLDGIHFCDMPWVINQSMEQQENKSMLAEIWPSSPNNPRYFALGMDAYQLASQLAQTGLPVCPTQGMTGLLHKEGQKIQRQLMCAKFEHGIAVPD